MNKTTKRGGWIGVDLDGTLAYDAGKEAAGAIGEPIPEMLDRVKDWLAQGIDVRIFTARISWLETEAERKRQVQMIGDWCMKHLGRRLAVTCEKDRHMWMIWDDRAVQVVKNTGERVGEVYRDAPSA